MQFDFPPISHSKWQFKINQHVLFGAHRMHSYVACETVS